MTKFYRSFRSDALENPGYTSFRAKIAPILQVQIKNIRTISKNVQFYLPIGWNDAVVVPTKFAKIYAYKKLQYIPIGSKIEKLFDTNRLF